MDFSEQREKIKFYYETQGRELKDVQRIMAEEHRFVASVSMYKKKIRQWQLQRNLRANEKDLILAALSTRRQEGLEPRHIVWQGKIVPMSILSRHYRETHKGEHIPWADEGRVAQNTQLWRPLPLPTEMRHAALISHQYTAICEAVATPQIAVTFAQPGKSLYTLYSLQDYCSIASQFALLGQFSAARNLLNQAGNLLLELSFSSTPTAPTPALAFLPITLALLHLVHRPVRAAFDTIGLFYHHCVALLKVRLGPQNPLAELLSSFLQVEDKVGAYFCLSESTWKSLGMLAADNHQFFTNQGNKDASRKDNNSDQKVIRDKSFGCLNRFLLSHKAGSVVTMAPGSSPVDRLRQTLQDNERTFGPLHRTTLSNLSSLAWFLMTQHVPEQGVSGVGRAARLFDELIARLWARQSVDQIALQVNGPHDVIFMAESLRGSLIAAAKLNDLEKLSRRRQEGLKLLAATPLQDLEYHNHISAFFNNGEGY